MSHTRDVALDTNAENYLFYDSEINTNDDWNSDDFNKLIQSKGDLGERISTAFQTVLAKNDKAVIIGSDCPEITADIIEEAFAKLELVDVVVGPTHDGGYYLLGMKERHTSLLEDIAWSTEDVYEQTRKKIIQEGLLFTALEKLSDLDNIDDLNNFPEFA